MPAWQLLILNHRGNETINWRCAHAKNNCHNRAYHDLRFLIWGSFHYIRDALTYTDRTGHGIIHANFDLTVILV